MKNNRIVREIKKHNELRNERKTSESVMVLFGAKKTIAK